uniref:Uncharacterized protein n=1 Tax=Rhabditophanes sp. KR3021 TaxID=114890 RepID=A0AC35UHB7_9BILA
MTAITELKSMHDMKNKVAATHINQNRHIVNEQLGKLKKPINKLQGCYDNRFNRTYTFGADLVSSQERRNSLSADSDIFDYNIDDLMKGIKPRHPSRKSCYGSRNNSTESNIKARYPSPAISSSSSAPPSNEYLGMKKPVNPSIVGLCREKWAVTLPSLDGLSKDQKCCQRILGGTQLELRKYHDSIRNSMK